MLIDFRHETFLALCKIKNYTKTAEHLHITQPAVTQHIQYLENYYQCKLLVYENRKIRLTKQGEQLREYVTTVTADNDHFRKSVLAANYEEIHIHFGATLSIGEYVMPDILSRLLKEDTRLKIHMAVANTQTLLEKLNQGELDFILVEGIYDKARYESVLFSKEKFVPVCANGSAWSKGGYTLQDLAQSQLILREQGSGTREIFETILHTHNYTLSSFKAAIEIGNMAAIKQLVANDVGITFLFEVAAKKELERKELCVIQIEDFAVEREFNFVFLKDSFYKNKYVEYLELIKNKLKK